SLFSIDGESLKMLDTLVIDGEAAAVTFAPDGKAALVTKFAEHHVALLRIVEDKLVYDAKQDIPVGLWPYNVKITPDGKVAIVCNTGNNGLPDGHCDTLSVIGLSTKEPHVASTVSVGDGPEGLAISPDGKYVAVPLLNGSADMFKDEWFYHPHGEVVLYELKGTGLTERSRVKTGAFPEGISFSADGSRLFVANLADGNLSTFSVNKGRLASEGEPLRIPVPGKPGSMGSAQP
ncbi:MAG: YncE family protein, partial [Verrucomicrobiota bacterium]